VPTQVITAELPEGGAWERMAVLYDRVADAVAGAVEAGERPVVMSGDCTTSLGTVTGLQRAGIDPAIVWFDAHGDLNTLESSPSGYLGGVVLRLLLGYGRELIADRLGLRDVAEERVTLTDARDLDPGEADYLAGAAVRHLTNVNHLEEDTLPEGPIYLHLDLDVVAGLPGALYPAPGGSPVAEVAAAVRRVRGDRAGRRDRGGVHLAPRPRSRRLRETGSGLTRKARPDHEGAGGRTGKNQAMKRRFLG
jgi:arginase